MQVIVPVGTPGPVVDAFITLDFILRFTILYVDASTNQPFVLSFQGTDAANECKTIDLSLLRQQPIAVPNPNPDKP